MDWRNSCNWEASLPPSHACITHPALTGHAFGCYCTLWLISYFTAGANHISKLGELQWRTVLKLWTDGIGVFFSNECVATQKQRVFRCRLVTGQVKWVLGTRAAGSADTEGSCLHPWLWCLWLKSILLHKHIQMKKKKKASIIDKAKASSIYICSKAAIIKRCFNVSQGLDETLKMLLLRKKL